MDALAAMARDAHRQAVENVRLASHFRTQRDDAIRRLHAQGDLSYTQIAEQVGITRELVAKIVQGRTNDTTRDTNLAKALWRANCEVSSARWEQLPPDVQQHWLARAEGVHQS